VQPVNHDDGADSIPVSLKPRGDTATVRREFAESGFSQRIIASVKAVVSAKVHWQAYLCAGSKRSSTSHDLLLNPYARVFAEL
jgi:hypothetical protein